MFTGIVETTGVVVAVKNRADGIVRLEVESDLALRTVPIGGSVAVDGVCLTAVSKRGRKFAADLGPETLRLTTLAGLRTGARVHLERPLKMGDPLGGHLVAGHVDGVGKVRRARKTGGALELDIRAPATVRPYLSRKGSVTVCGVSLTVNTLRGAVFGVTLIPHTLAVTNLGRLKVGDAVNLEADGLAKQVVALVDARLDHVLSSRITRRSIRGKGQRG